MFKKALAILILALIFFPAVYQLLGRGYFNMHDDLQVMRIFEMEKCFADGQIPCRWAPDMAWGYGQAMFNFYSAFPYYLGVFIRKVAPLSIMGTVRTLFLVSMVGSGIGMYLLAKQLWGRIAGIFAATLYVYAPYHALDIYIRGALAESFALAILPFLWHSLYLLIKKQTFNRVIYVSFSVFALLTSHNISIMIYAPITAIWIIFWLIYEKKWRSVRDLILAGVLGFGMAAFFIIPVLTEKILIQSQFLTMDYLSYSAHFVTIRQLLLDRSWGHGPSIWGPNDEISFQIGWPYWILAIPLGIFVLIKFFKSEDRKYSLVVLGLLLISVVAAFLTHSRSTFIWQKISVLSFVQFPWRFLGIVIFTLSFALGYIARPKIIFRKIWLSILILVVILLNYQYFVPWNRSYSVTDKEKLSGVAFELQQKSAILDYLPKTAPVAPKERAPDNPWLINGEGEASSFSKRSNSFFFDAQVYSNEAEIQIPVMDFPSWVVVEGGKIIPSYPSGDYGVITIKLPEGKHIIQGRFENTPIREFSNNLTLLTFSLIFVGVILKVNDRRFLWL